MQKTFSEAEYAGKKKLTRRDRFLNEIDQLAPWALLGAQIAPFYADNTGKRGRPSIGLSRMLRLYVVQQCFGLSDEGTEDAVYDSQAVRLFVGIDLSHESAPDATTLLKFRRLLETHQLTQKIFAAINQHLSAKGRSEVALYFRSTSALAAFESGPSIKIDQVTRSVLRFWPPRAPRSSHFPHYRCTFPAVVSKCRRAIHRFDSANSVTS